MRDRSTEVKQKLEACGGCTCYFIGDTGSVRQEHRPRFTNSGSVSTKPIQGIHSLIYPSTFIAEHGRSSRWRAAPAMFNRGSSGSLISTGKRRTTFWNCLPKSASVFHTTICQLSSSYKDHSGRENKTTIRRPLARLGMTRIAICAASSTSGPNFSVVRRFGGKGEMKEKGMDKTRGQLYVRSSTAARARPCGRHTKKWKP